MAIPTHQQWMTDTGLGALRNRSAPLKAVDDAILQYERAKTQDNLWKVKHAFEDWKRAEMNWRGSDRNRGGAITRLDQELGTLVGIHFTLQELQALAFVAQERKKVIAKVFEGKEVTFRNSPKAVKEAVSDTAEKVRTTCAEAKAFLEGRGKRSPLSAGDIARQKLEEMAKGLFSVDSLETLGSLSGFILGIIEKCGVSVAPVVGQIKDGYDLFTGWAKAGAALHEQHGISE